MCMGTCIPPAFICEQSSKQGWRALAPTCWSANRMACAVSASMPATGMEDRGFQLWRRIGARLAMEARPQCEPRMRRPNTILPASGQRPRQIRFRGPVLTFKGWVAGAEEAGWHHQQLEPRPQRAQEWTFRFGIFVVRPRCSDQGAAAMLDIYRE